MAESKVLMSDVRMAMTCKICGRLLCGFADRQEDPEVPFVVMPYVEGGERRAGRSQVRGVQTSSGCSQPVSGEVKTSLLGIPGGNRRGRAK